MLKWASALDLNRIVEICADHFDEMPQTLKMGSDGVYRNEIDQEFTQVYSIDERISRLISMIKESTQDPQISRLTADIIRSCRPHDSKCELSKIFNYTRNHIRYVADQHNVEVFKDPNLSIYDPDNGFEVGLGGDCDDQSLFLSASALIAGFPVKLKVIGHDDWDHIYPMVAVDKERQRNWVSADASVPHPLGYDQQDHDPDIKMVKEYVL